MQITCMHLDIVSRFGCVITKITTIQSTIINVLTMYELRHDETKYEKQYIFHLQTSLHNDSNIQEVPNLYAFRLNLSLSLCNHTVHIHNPITVDIIVGYKITDFGAVIGNIGGSISFVQLKLRLDCMDDKTITKAKEVKKT